VTGAAARSAPIGVAVIGAGTIGTLRARLAASHPGVGFVAVCDIDADRQQMLAEAVDAGLADRSADRVIADERVDCVIVATSEDDHAGPLEAAIEAGKPALVEKPFTVDPGEGRRLAALARERGSEVAVGYTQRFRRRYLSAKDHVDRGYLGELTTVSSKIYVTRAVGEVVMARAGRTTPAINTLTYCGDLLLWYLEGQRPVSVYAQSSRSHLHDLYGVADATTAIVRFDGGVVASLTTSWEPPREHPAYVAQMQLELFGREGMLGINDDHRDQLLVSDTPIPSPYTPHVATHAALLGSAMPGDWAVGGFHGPMKTETDIFIEGVIAGRLPEILPDAEHGLAVLELMRAIDDSADSGEVVRPSAPAMS
jgi:myo-inositol 2-dehydrogenase / D-chiro-inositol 1-dehydrogenase